ncbi:MAG: DUF2007 domain-containing protein [Deltaproteobacteria bacterium]|nr:DUF2007 domain-containing protein [Deltaproteobacteria bacterium]
MDDLQTHAFRKRLSRVIVTVLACVGTLAARYVVAPGVDPVLLYNKSGESDLARASVVAMGVQPIISAYLLVELFSVVVRRFRPYRHEPKGRRKLERATAVVAVALCFFQSFGVKMYLQGYSSLDAPAYVFMPTLIAGTFALWVLANWITEHGLGNGIMVLASVTLIADVLSAITSKTGPLGIPQSATPLYLRAVGFAAAAAVVASATIVLFARTRTRSSRQRTARALPAPSSGLNPLMGAAAISALVPWLSVAAFGFYRPVVWYVVDAALIVVVTPVLAWLFNQPERVAGVMCSCNHAAPARSVQRAREMLLSSLPMTVAFVLMVRAAELLGVHLEGGGVFYVFAWIVAAALDAADQWRMVDGHWTVAWREHRPYAISAAERLLDKEGIAWRIVGLRQRALVPFGGPFIPIEVFVANDDFERAHELLAEALTGERIVAAPPEVPRLADLARKSLAKAFNNRRVLAMWAFAACILAIAAVVMTYSREIANPPKLTLEERRSLILLFPVEDSIDPLDHGFPAALPENAEQGSEVAPLGKGRSKRIHYVHFSIDPSGDAEKARQAAEAWLVNLPKIEGARYAISDTYHEDEDGFRKLSGIRTWLLREDVVLTGEDIKDAAVVNTDKVYVAMSLVPNAAYGFEHFTRENTNRRMAIVVRGRVVSAPVIASAIKGGHLQVTLGEGPRAQQLEDAHRIVDALNGRP